MDPRNVSRRIAVVLTGVLSSAAAYVDTIIIPDGDDQAPPASANQWVRIQVDDIDAQPAGRLGGSRAEVRRSLVTVDCFTRGRALQGQGSRSYDAVDGLAYTIRATLSSSAMNLPDYVTDSTGATSTGRLLQFTGPALLRRLDPIDGVQRRQVLATATLVAQV